MAQPKKKMSKTRSRKRRTHYKLPNVTVAECPKCHEAKAPHRACTACGYYKDMEVIKVKE